MQVKHAPRFSAEQYRLLRPYLQLGERLGALVAPGCAFGQLQSHPHFVMQESQPEFGFARNPQRGADRSA